MERITALFVDGIGTAAATSGVLSQVQGRIFGLLYLQSRPLSLDEIARELDQSKGNISLNMRGLVDWHLVHRRDVAGSRRDHYEAATDLWRVMQEILERRFRWNLRQVLISIEETLRALESARPGKDGPSAREAQFITARLEAMRAFFSAVDTGITAFNSGKAIAAETFQKVVRLVKSR
jgi:DNA-binding transcriptional regulator GbsR (MarR family)